LTSNAHKRILIAPLDWGLGHTTRCIPVINWLFENGHIPVFAGNNWQQQYIRKTFERIEIIHLDGYDVTYGKNKAFFRLSLIAQLPRLMTTVRNEHEWIARHASSLKIDGIISDNRYGLFHKHIPSVFMTHQLQIQTGLGKTADHLVRKLHYKLIGRFTACWVPDIGDTVNLSGALGHPRQIPCSTKYIGLLSQLAGATHGGTQHVLVLLSGPEPQRSLLSSRLWELFLNYPSEVVFVEGTNSAVAPAAIPAHISYHKQITKKELLPLLQNASIVYCRSGYSTLMDLVALGKKAVVIPTPGQTEQEYLAKHLHHQGIFYHLPQREIAQQHHKDLAVFPFKQLPVQHSYKQFEAVIDEWINTL